MTNSNNDSNDDARGWVVEHPVSAFDTEVVSVEGDRIDAIEHALRLAKEESERTGEPYDAGVAHEKHLLTGTEHIYYHFECSRKRWQVVRALPSPDEMTDEEMEEFKNRTSDGVIIDVVDEDLPDECLEELTREKLSTVYGLSDENTAPEEVETEPPEEDLLDDDHIGDDGSVGKSGEDGKVPLPDCDAATAGWPDGEDPPDIDVDADPEDEWVASTTPTERICSVLRTTYDPRTVGELAERAAVSEERARSAIEVLEEIGVLVVEETERGRGYKATSTWWDFQKASSLADWKRTEDLLASAREKARRYREKYGVESPDELQAADRELTDEELRDLSWWRSAEKEVRTLRLGEVLAEYREEIKEDDPGE